jgi:DNA-directed RNA polymerase subunit RPC12/RpoP
VNVTAEPTPRPSEDASAHVDEATVAVPYAHRQYVCPDCEREIPDEQQYRLAKPADAAHLLNDVLKCPFCACIFSPRPAERTVLRIPIADSEVDVEEIGRLFESTRVTIPYPSRLYECPECKREIPTRAQIRLAKPARHEHELNDVLKCPYCSILFSPKANIATVLRG